MALVLPRRIPTPSPSAPGGDDFGSTPIASDYDDHADYLARSTSTA